MTHASKSFEDPALDVTFDTSRQVEASTITTTVSADDPSPPEMPLHTECACVKKSTPLTRTCGDLERAALQGGSSATAAEPAADDERDYLVFVGGLPYHLMQPELVRLFTQWGEVASVRLIKDKGKTNHKGYGFVKFACKEGASRVRALGSVMYDGVPIDVRAAVRGVGKISNDGAQQKQHKQQQRQRQRQQQEEGNVGDDGAGTSAAEANAASSTFVGEHRSKAGADRDYHAQGAGEEKGEYYHEEGGNYGDDVIGGAESRVEEVDASGSGGRATTQPII